MHPERDANKAHEQEPLPNRAVEEFFVSLNRSVRRPKPSDQEVAQAIESIQNLTQQVSLKQGSLPGEGDVVSSCPNCRAKNVARNRFCGYCGARLPAVEKATVSPEAPTPEPHVHHHHYHHFSQPPDKASLAPSSLWVAQTAERAVDAERAIPKLVEEWCLLWNAKRLEDLVGLYSVDAIVLRPRAAYAQGRAAIRQLFKTALEAGVGEFELACGDLGVAGELACLAGYVQAAVPSAAGKRLEGSGKCLLVLRWEAGEWKIVADAWCLDERPSAAAESEGATILPMRSSLK